MQTALTMMYREMGWDEVTGAPTRETLEKFGLGDVADDLASKNLLAKEIAAEQKTGVNVYQTNTYSAPTSRLQLWKNKRDTEAALRLALVTT